MPASPERPPPPPTGRAGDVAAAWSQVQQDTGFSEEDARLLSGLRRWIAPQLDEITEDFLARLARFDETRRSSIEAADGPLLGEIREAFQRWLLALFEPARDPQHIRRTARIGRAHVSAGLPARSMFAAVSTVRERAWRILETELPAGDRLAASAALTRATEQELAVMISAYMEAHERRQLEDLQRVIVENLPVTVLCLDEAGRVRAASRAGLLPDCEPEGRHYEDFIPAELLESADLPTRVGECLATDRVVEVPRARLGSGADERLFRLILVPLRHPLARLLIHIDDVTEVLRAEARLCHEDNDRRLGSLAAQVAHGVRNPLAGVQAAVQLLRASMEPTDERVRVMDRLSDEIGRVDALLGELMLYTQPVDPRLERCHLDAVAREVTARGGGRAEVVDEGAPPVLADPRHVASILCALLRNARTAAGPDGTVRVRVGPGPVVRVEDDGPGIVEGDEERVLEPFFTRTGGTGLGLAVARRLAEAMGGRLVLERARPGACFLLRLPAADVGALARPGGATGGRTSPGGSAGRSG